MVGPIELVSAKLLDAIIGALIAMGLEGAWGGASRSEIGQRVLKRFGMDAGPASKDFADVYRYALILYGIGKPRELLEIFREKDIQQAFRDLNQTNELHKIADHVASMDVWSRVREPIERMDVDPQWLFTQFGVSFKIAVDRAKNPIDTRAERDRQEIFRQVFDNKASTEEILRMLGQMQGVSAADERWEIGAAIDKGEHRYTLVKELGKGGNGTVWLGRESTPDGNYREVAIKVLHQDISEEPERVNRFKRELGTVMRMEHDHIVTIHNWGRHSGQLYAVMQYMPMGSLRDRIGNDPKRNISGSPVSFEQALAWLEQIAGALHYAHTRSGLVHRDVKPENMLLGEMDGKERLYLADFGLVISPDQRELLREGSNPAGTGRYMAPEQWRKEKLDRRVDIYALGILAYELLTGHRPFQFAERYDNAEDKDEFLKTAHCETILPADSHLSPEIHRVIAKAAAKRAEDRYGSVREFVTDLRHWEADPANIDARVPDYLRYLQTDIFERIREQFVELSGSQQALRRVKTAKVQPRSGLTDDEEFWSFVSVQVEADHVKDEMAGPQPVPNVRERLCELKRAVLVGEPGSGKTWTLSRLALDYAAGWQAGNPQRNGAARIPVLVFLNQFTGADAAGQPQTFEAFVRASLGVLSGYHDVLRREGRLVLLCDALNEMPRRSPALDGSGGQRDLLPEVRAYLTEADTFVVSCRARDYTDDLNELEGLEQIILRELDPPAIREFVMKRLPENGDELWAEMGGSDDLLQFWDEVVEQKLTELFWEKDDNWPGEIRWTDQYWHWQQMHHDPRRLMLLSRNPFTAHLLCGAYAAGGGELSASRAGLFAEFIQRMFAREQKTAERRGERFPDTKHIDRALVALSGVLQANNVTVIDHGAALAALTMADAEWLLTAAANAGLVAVTGDTVKFAHQLFQEYYAVQILLEKMGDPDNPNYVGAAEIFDDEWWDAKQWHETTVILGEFLGGAEGANQAARWLARTSPEVALGVITCNAGGLELEDVQPETRAALVGSAHNKTSESNPRGRAAAYRVLTLLDADERPGIGLGADGLPEIAWGKLVLPGVYPIGDKGQSDNPPREFELTYSFQLAKYPVTYRQFQAFIDDPEGFQDERWWDGLVNNQYRRENQSAPGEQAFEYWNHPRERVSWYDAIAFCRWLSWRLGGGYDLDRIGEWVVRLPTETEWEIAARGKDGREYPYEGSFDAKKGNVVGTGIRLTSAVGIFPDGASPYGVLDMSGNVREWCLTEDSNPAPDAVRENLRSDARRGMRGGSWNRLPRYARAACHLGYAPGFSNYSIGFRVCCVRPTSEE